MQSQFKQIFYTFSIPTKITAQENDKITPFLVFSQTLKEWTS